MACCHPFWGLLLSLSASFSFHSLPSSLPIFLSFFLLQISIYQKWNVSAINTYFARLILNNFIFDVILNDIFIWNPHCSLLVLGKAYVLLLFSCSVLSNSLWPYELHHISLPCPPPSLGVCSKSGPLNQRCHPTISSSVVRFSSCRQSFQHQDLFQWVSSSHQVAKV